LGAWVVAIILGILVTLVVFLVFRFGVFTSLPVPSPIERGSSRFALVQEFLAGGLWQIYRTIGRLFIYASNLLEGDGGLLWTLLILVLFVSLLRAQ
jgi:hypothetical protein